MQILGTEVSHATAATGESIVRLVFQGEGGERISVDMASDGRDDYPAAEVLQRARVMLVQTATFGAESGSTAASGADRPGADALAPAPDGENYLFEYREGEGSRHAPARLPGIDAVRAEALRCAVDLLEEGGPSTQSGWLIRVYDESGALVCSIDATEAIAEHQKARAAITI